MLEHQSSENLSNPNLISSTNNFISFEDFLLYNQNLSNKKMLREIYNKLISNNLNPKNFYIINKNSIYIPVIRYTYALSLVLKEIEEMEVDISRDDIGEYAYVKIKRKGFSAPFLWKYYAKEYKTNYNEKFYFMLRKACIISALKIIFADIFEKINFYFLFEDTEPEQEQNSEQINMNYANYALQADNYTNKSSSSSSSSSLLGLSEKHISMYNVLRENYGKTGVDIDQVLNIIAKKYNRDSFEMLDISKKASILENLYFKVTSSKVEENKTV